MRTLLLFDQDTQHYRQSVYRYFRKAFAKLDYNLKIVYDNKLNSIKDDPDLFIGADYTLFSLIKIINQYKPPIIIQFIWMRYKFLIPFMIYNKIRGIKTIVWSHGINLQNKNQPLKNILYYTRQLLANALIIYTPEQKQFIKASHKKLFVANNTINFNDLPITSESKEELKEKYGYENKKVVLSVGRFNVNNRKVDHLIELSQLLSNDFHIIIAGPGVLEKEGFEISQLERIEWRGSIYNQNKICELYKMADLFIMPGAIGLAINQAFYFDTPVIIEDVEHGPEVFYLKEKTNGLLYETGNIYDLKKKVDFLFQDDNHQKYSIEARKTALIEASIEKMLGGFKKAIKYVEND